MQDQDVTRADQIPTSAYTDIEEVKGQPRDRLYTISGVKKGEVVEPKSKQKGIKASLEFSDFPRRVVINKRRHQALNRLFGTEPVDWIGKRITLDTGTFDGKEQISITGSPDKGRTKPPAPASNFKQQPGCVTEEQARDLANRCQSASVEFAAFFEAFKCTGFGGVKSGDVTAAQDWIAENAGKVVTQ